ncbi:hypothetical protein PS15m_010090 [Mucor circinelloides]
MFTLARQPLFPFFQLCTFTNMINPHLFISTTCSHFLQNWNQHTSKMSKTIFTLSVFNLLLQIFLITFTLYQTRQLPCDEPFRPFLIVHGIRTLISTLFSIYVRMGIPMLDQESRSTRKALKRWQSIIKVFSVVWFLYGNYLTFFSTAVTCALTATHLFNLSCVIVFYGYMLYVTPLIASFLQHVLIPCIIDILQLLYIIERDDGGESLFDCSGASEKEISELPTYYLTSTAQDETLLPKESPVCDHSSSIPTITIPNQDRVCVICLSFYEESDVLCKLW